MSRIEELRNTNVIFYGTGSMSYRVYQILAKMGIFPVAVVDSNSQKFGRIWKDELRISSYEEVTRKYDRYVILMTVSINNAISIREGLKSRGEKNPIYHMQCSFKVDDELLAQDDNIFQLADFFEDELSRQIFYDFIFYKMTGDMEGLLKYTDGDSFFDSDIIRRRKDHVYIDVGCYTGDTISRFLMFCDNSYAQITGMEADPGISKSAQRFIELGRLKNASIINKGGWNEHKYMEFQTIKNNESILFDSPNLFKSTSEIMDTTLIDTENDIVYESVSIECDSLDHLFQDVHPTIIKINALAADLPILQGARKIMKNDGPYIVMDYGTRPSYIHETIEVIKNSNCNYKLYLREKEIFGDYKTILYAVPECI